MKKTSFIYQISPPNLNKFQQTFNTCSTRCIIVWHADEKEPRVDVNQVAHRFHMFLQILWSFSTADMSVVE